LNRYELLARLVNEGFVAQQFSVLSIGLAKNDGMALEQNDAGQFAIFSYERGQRGELLLASDSEQEICERYYQLVCQEPFVVLMLGSKLAAQQVQSVLSTQKIESTLHNIPASLFGAIKHQVVVKGRDLGKARFTLLFSTEPLPKKWWQFWD
jgi:hypothetical protein